MSVQASAYPAKSVLVMPGIFLLYLALLALGIGNHELWGDELHSWNIAKASGSIADLIRNSRYEGHPPAWYLVMWLLSRFTHELAFLQLVQFLIISAAVFLVLFRSPFPGIVKALIPFGYYFLFEYGMLSRNYAIGVLPALGICVMLSPKGAKPRSARYYLLLLILANTHLLGVLLAASLHLVFLLRGREAGWPSRNILAHAVAGSAAGAVALYVIKPPGDSSLNFDFWMNIWDARHHLGVIAAAPLKAMVPLPAWWNHHFWNTHFLLDPAGWIHLRNVAVIAASGGILTLTWILFRGSRFSLYLFGGNLLLTGIVSMMASLTNMRYVGFIYIGFIAAAWLLCAQGPLSPRQKGILIFFAFMQIPGGLFAWSADVRRPFSRGEKVGELIRQVPAGGQLVTDYWCLNTVVAYTDMPVYCIDLDRTMSFLQWDSSLFRSVTSRTHYTQGFDRIFSRPGVSSVYMISINPWDMMMQKDTLLAGTRRVELIDKRGGSIEKGSDLYLYRIHAAPAGRAPGAIKKHGS